MRAKPQARGAILRQETHSDGTQRGSLAVSRVPRDSRSRLGGDVNTCRATHRGDNHDRHAARAAELLSGFAFFYELRDLFADLRCRVQIAAVVTTLVAMIVVTVASGGGSAAQGISSTAKNLMTAAKVLGAVAEVVKGSSGVAQGAIGIEVAEINRDADKSRASAKEIEAILAQLQAQSEEQTARLKEIIQALDEGMAQFSQMVAAAGDQRANQVKNLVRA